MIKSIFCLINIIAVSAVFAGDNPALFQNDKLINIEISGDMKAIRKGRHESYLKRAYHPITIVEKNGVVDPATAIIAEMQVRGDNRLKKCDFPPLKINLKKDVNMNTSIFKGAKKVKMVTQCDKKEKAIWVNRELLIYKIYETLSPLSFKTKPANVVFRDRSSYDYTNLNGAIYDTQFTFMLENASQVGKRNGNLFKLEVNEYDQSLVDRFELSKIFLFHYLVGEHDMEISSHDVRNVELYQDTVTKKVYPAPYDFDYSMLVRMQGNIEYMSYIRQICGFNHELYKVRPIFIQNKAKIFSIVSEFPYLSEAEKTRVKNSFTEFYRRIENDAVFAQLVNTSERCKRR